MIIFPAIDLLDGKCVRLYQGTYNSSEVVAESALDTAVKFKEQGAKWLHIVDLNGARGEIGKNFDIIKNLASSSGLFIQSGGGIRTLDAAKKYIDCGVKRIILGSAALNNPNLVYRCIESFSPEAVAVGIDAKDGLVHTQGWLNSNDVYYTDLAKKMCQSGVKYIIFTDISRDGTLRGPNIDMLKELKENVTCNITASGGIRDINDITELKKLNIYGAICGKSLYKGTLNLKDAIAAADK